MIHIPDPQLADIGAILLAAVIMQRISPLDACGALRQRCARSRVKSLMATLPHRPKL